MKRNKASKRPPSQVRKHYYLNQYVVIAPKRKDRPFSVSDKPKSGVSVKSKPLPIENDPSVYELTDEHGEWLVKVVENLYPALSTNNPKAYGKQEIVLETQDENKLFHDLSVDQITRVFKTYQSRVAAIKRDKKIKHITVFKNYGHEAGASMAHTHSQIIAIDFVPPDIEQEAKVFQGLFRRFGASPLGAALEWEREEQVRIINSSLYITAFAPYASRHPFEVWLVPHRHIASILEASDNELASFARILKQVASALDSKNISFNYFLHEGMYDHNHHFAIKIAPRPNIWAGFELDTGIIINSVSPEAAASWYRNFIRHHNVG